jgi:hypothetical protein
LSTTTRLSATNYLLIDAGESTDQRQIEKAPDCNRTPPKSNKLKTAYTDIGGRCLTISLKVRLS